MFRQYQKIMIVNGDLLLWEDGGSGRTYPCPFAYPRPCGTWCPHFGEVKPVEPIVNGSVVLERADGMKYQLQLSCGSGITIDAKEFEVVSFDASKGSVGVGHPVNVSNKPEPKHSKSFFGKLKSLFLGE